MLSIWRNLRLFVYLQKKKLQNMKYLFLSILTAIALLAPATSHASKLEAKYGAVKNGYNFWLYQPDMAQDDEAKPVIIFLHGASLCGKDLNRVKRYGTINAIEKGRKIDAYVVAPQNPGGSWSPAKVMDVVDWIGENYNIDESRIYVMGMSLGGYGAIDVAAAFPERIAAAMSFCGGGTNHSLSNLNEVPLWIVHGIADRAISIKESDRVVSTMKADDPEVPRLHYDRIPGMDHSQPARFFYLDDCYDWLLSHSLNDEGRPVSAKFDIAAAARHAYSGLKNTKSGASKSYKKSTSKKKTHAKRKSGKKRRSMAKISAH